MPKLEDRLKLIKLKDFHFQEDGTITLGDEDIAHIKAVFTLLKHIEVSVVVES